MRFLGVSGAFITRDFGNVKGVSYGFMDVPCGFSGVSRGFNERSRVF